MVGEETDQIKSRLFEFISIALEILGAWLLLIAYTWIGGPYKGLIISILGFLLVLYLIDKQNLFKLFLRFDPREFQLFLPIGIEFMISLIVVYAFVLIEHNSVVINPGDLGLFFQYLSQEALLIIREELATSFCWFLIAFKILNLFNKSEINPKQIKLMTILFALIFALFHIPNLSGIMSINSGNVRLWVFLFGIAYSGFCLGLYLKTLFIKTFSLPLVVIAHFLINLPRHFNDLYRFQLFSPELSVIFLFFLTPSIYLIYTITCLFKQVENPRLKILIMGIKQVGIPK